MFRRILFPVDFSEVSPRIVPVVADVATQHGSQVHVLFVARIMEHFRSIYVPHPSINRFQLEIVQGAERKLEEFIHEHLQGLDVISRVVSGDPAEEILKYADGAAVDLIVMGTHGRKGLEKILFGSVAERVVKNASVPVLTINPYR